MATDSLAGQIPIDLVSVIDTLDTTCKLTKTLKLKLLSTWKYLSETIPGDNTEAIAEFVRLLTQAHKQLWEVDQTLVSWYQSQFLNQCKNATTERALKSFVTDSEYKSLKTSIWGNRVITDMKAPKAAKKIATRETITNELPSLFDLSLKELALEVEDKNQKYIAFKQAELNPGKTLSLKVLDIKKLDDQNKEVKCLINSNSPGPLKDSDLNIDIERKKICYIVKNTGSDKGGIVYYLPPADFATPNPVLTEYKITKDFSKGIVHPSEQGPVAVFELSSPNEVLIFRPDIQNPKGPGVWGENLNKSKSRTLVAFDYRNQHGIILLRESNKFYGIFFNDKCEITLDDRSKVLFDTELPVPPTASETYLSTHIYFKPNGLPFPYFFNIFESFVLVNFYSNNKGAAYVSIRCQKLDLKTPVKSADWVWIACQKYGIEEALMMKPEKDKICWIKF